VSRARVDDAASLLKQAQARVDELSASLRVAHMPARPDERAATQANATAASEVLRQSQWRVSQRQQSSPVDAQVAEVFFQAGEFVPAGQVVVSLLPPNRVKARFFVSEADLAALQPGQAVHVHCDGCPPTLRASITRIATLPEFTPPVIYSNAQRAKLVFMVEAQPDAGNTMPLKPGQPLEIRLQAPKP